VNSYTHELLRELDDALLQARFDDEVNVLVITGKSEKFFSAGADINMLANKPLSYKNNFALHGHEVLTRIENTPKLVIAAVNGHAVGAGLGIAMSCDLRLASQNAKFGTAFAKVGFGGDYGTSWQLTRLVGQAKAKELFFLGDILGAEEAIRVGLANRVLPAEGFKAEALRVAAKIANGPLVSYRYMKENVNLSLTQDFRTILDREAMTHLRCGMTEDHKEGVKAFMEKREPVFRGR
jgi:2-(1,2-epoxy-1,2-dihydrophenyl)acetyl-CoA isomerase